MQAETPIEFVKISREDESYQAFSYMLPADEDPDDSGWIFTGCCTDEGEPLGVLCYCDYEEECEITWLYVDSEYRRTGIATVMIEEFLNSRLSWHCFRDVRIYVPANAVDDLPHTPLEDYDDDFDLDAFFRNSPRFDVSGIENVYVLDPQQWLSSITLNSLSTAANDNSICHFWDQEPSFISNTFKQLEQYHHYLISDMDEWEYSCVKDLCFCSKAHEELEAVIFVHRLKEKVLEVSCIYSKDAKALSGIFAKVFRILCDSYKDHTIVISTNNPHALSIIGRFFPDAQEDHYYITYTWNYSMDFEEID